MIYEAIASIMKQIDPIKKGRKNAQQGYSFRGVDDAMNAFSSLFADNGVFPAVHNIENIYDETVTSKSGTAGYARIRRYTFRLYHTDGTYIEAKMDGEAIDYGDKATNKAQSVAYREFLFKTFCVPFENDDIENHDHELTPKKNVIDSAAEWDNGVDVPTKASTARPKCPKCGLDMNPGKDGKPPYCYPCWKNSKK